MPLIKVPQWLHRPRLPFQALQSKPSRQGVQDLPHQQFSDTVVEKRHSDKDISNEQQASTGCLDDDTKSIQAIREKIRLCIDGSPALLDLLEDLEKLLDAHSRRTPSLWGVSASLNKWKTLVDVAQEDYEKLPIVLGSIATALARRYEELRDGEDISDAILYFQKALQLAESGCTALPMLYHHSAQSFVLRYQDRRDIEDLSLAVSDERRALETIPKEHPEFISVLTALGRALELRHIASYDDNVDDLEEAISTLEEAVSIDPSQHSLELGLALLLLGRCYTRRSSRIRDFSGYEKAISTISGAKDMIPRDDAAFVDAMANLGWVFHTRYRQAGDVEDLNQAIDLLQRSADTAPKLGPVLPSIMIAAICAPGALCVTAKSQNAGFEF